MPKGGWEALGLQPELLKAIHTLDWMLPTDVQDEAIPPCWEEEMCASQRKAGSGKTAALTMFKACSNRDEKIYDCSRRVGVVRRVKIRRGATDSIQTIEVRCVESPEADKLGIARY